MTLIYRSGPRQLAENNGAAYEEDCSSVYAEALSLSICVLVISVIYELKMKTHRETLQDYMAKDKHQSHYFSSVHTTRSIK